ncbi:MAG TPA: DUF2318 domain-containing protein [Blastocatellia bacterium]|nr:DUF2318 domain-containing protein [Blastocatellia bacterium]
MTNKHDSHTTDSRERKRAQFSGPGRQNRKMTSVLSIILGALVVIAVYLVMNGRDDKPASTTVIVANPGPAQRADAQQSGDILIPISDVSSGRAKFFDYTASDGRSMRFFVVKSSDGVYRAALDACDVCYAAKLGYYQDGDGMVCKKCGLRFATSLVNEVSGGCNPVGLPRTVEGDHLIIKATELESRKAFF